ncbi:hypothetical protein B0H13DRAFT_1899999 [Mycena leptocephala]|nr:hypothetical protein B0H13DRAFT_1899999 [Mycena leptocephala]
MIVESTVDNDHDACNLSPEAYMHKIGSSSFVNMREQKEKDTMYPPAHQHAAALMWTFNIGFSGQGQGSILREADRATRGIRLFALNMEEEWQEFTLFQVPASTRVRIEYAPDLMSTSPKRRSVELVFPAVPPTQGPVPVQQLL